MWTVVIVVVVIRVVVVSSSDGGDVTPPFPPDWPNLGAVEEVMAVVRTPGDITVDAGSTDGTAWVGLVVVPECSRKARYVQKNTHNTQYLETDQWYFSGSVSDRLPKCHNCQNAPVWYLCKMPSNSQFYAWLVFCMYWTFIKVEQHSWQINQFKNANEIVSCIEYANVTL